jgi:hypothetical protein
MEQDKMTHKQIAMNNQICELKQKYQISADEIKDTQVQLHNGLQKIHEMDRKYEELHENMKKIVHQLGDINDSKRNTRENENIERIAVDDRRAQPRNPFQRTRNTRSCSPVRATRRKNVYRLGGALKHRNDIFLLGNDYNLR